MSIEWPAINSSRTFPSVLGLRRAAGLALSTLLASGLVGGLFAGSAFATTAARGHSGSVDVLYAGSFLDLMQQQLAPAFHKATGYTVSGFSDGSSALASEIKGGTEVGDVFISASPTVNATLEGAANGSWVSSYDEFGRSPLVLGYNPDSKFARDLQTKPWYDVVDRSGFLLGRTDPATDPKGVLAVDALTGVGTSYDLPSLAALATSTSNVFAETSLVGELQAGQLDAGFFYAVEAAAAHIKTVPLTSTNLAAQYTVAVLKNAPHEAAAKAFVRFLIGASGQKILRANGITPISPARVFSISGGNTTTTSLP
jgi:molybdate/tungstate transport system substrate-binding protein